MRLGIIVGNGEHERTQISSHQCPTDPSVKLRRHIVALHGQQYHIHTKSLKIIVVCSNNMNHLQQLKLGPTEIVYRILALDKLQTATSIADSLIQVDRSVVPLTVAQ